MLRLTGQEFAVDFHCHSRIEMFFFCDLSNFNGISKLISDIHSTYTQTIYLSAAFEAKHRMEYNQQGK